MTAPYWEAQSRLDSEMVIRQACRPIKIQFGEQNDVTLDKNNVIIEHNGPIFETFAFPIRFSPDRRSLNKAGMTQQVDVIAWTSTEIWLKDHSLVYDEMKLDYVLMQIDGKMYRVQEKPVLNSHSGTVHLWILFAGNVVR